MVIWKTSYGNYRIDWNEEENSCKIRDMKWRKRKYQRQWSLIVDDSEDVGKKRRRREREKHSRLNMMILVWHFVVTMVQNIEKYYIESTHNLYTNCLIAFHVLICCWAVAISSARIKILPSSLMPMDLLCVCVSVAVAIFSLFLFLSISFRHHNHSTACCSSYSSPSQLFLLLLLMLWHCFDALVYVRVDYERSTTATSNS